MITFHRLLILGLILPLAKVDLKLDGCLLEPSDLGPDWYKVPQPKPAGFENIPDFEQHYIHMPCAIATVFDVGICGCTNMEAYLFSGVQKTSAPVIVKEEIDPLDMVKQRDPDEFRPPTEEKSGSLLLNTRTGEVTHCPFRASSRGSKWYLIREQTEILRPMKCAPGTVFSKQSCTCIHATFASREPSKPEDQDIVVLETEYDEFDDDDTISDTLQIKASDVDFRSPSPTVPETWGQPAYTTDEDDADVQDHKPIVVRFPNGNGIADTEQKDEASNDRLPKVEKGESDIRKTSPMFLDSFQNRNARREMFSENKNSDSSLQSLIFRPFDLIRNSNNKDKEKLNDESNDIAEIIVVKKTIKEPIPRENEQVNETPDTIKTDTIQGVEFLGNTGKTDPIQEPKLQRKQETPISEQECAKRPLPDLGPEYFSLYLWGVGWVPYACHGDRVYSDKTCTCIAAPG